MIWFPNINNTKKPVSKMKNISRARGRARCCIIWSRLVQTCPNLSENFNSNDQCFSHFHKKVVAKLQKKNYQTKQILLLIPPFHPSIIPNNFNATTIYLLFPKSQLFICVFNITSMKKEKNSEIYIDKQL